MLVIGTEALALPWSKPEVLRSMVERETGAVIELLNLSQARCNHNGATIKVRKPYRRKTCQSCEQESLPERSSPGAGSFMHAMSPTGTYQTLPRTCKNVFFAQHSGNLSGVVNIATEVRRHDLVSSSVWLRFTRRVRRYSVSSKANAGALDQS